MKAIYRRSLYYLWKIGTTDPAEIEVYKKLEGEQDWISDFDGKELSRYEVELDPEDKERLGVDTIFVVNRYNDFAEWEGRVTLHPDWFERID